MKKLLIFLAICSAGCRFVGVYPWKSDCGFVLPPPYSLVRFPDGKYGISSEPGKVWEWNVRYGEVWNDGPETNGVNDDMFSDSCDAKGMIEYKINTDNNNKFK